MDKEPGTVRVGMKLTPSEWKALEMHMQGIGWTAYVRKLIKQDFPAFPDNIVGSGAPKRLSNRDS